MKRSAQAARERSALRRRFAPPRALAALLVVVVIVGLAWALVVAPWQSPDELAHYAYSQSLAESFRIPGDPQRPLASSEESIADAAVGASRGAFFPQASPPDWNPSDYAAYLSTENGPHAPSRANGGGPSSADQNPPLYYGYSDVGYLIDDGGTAFGRLYAMRISGVLLLALTTIAAWLLAGEVFGRRRLAQLASGAVAGLLPMVTFMSTAVNPDALLNTLSTFALWLGARVINRRAQGRDVAALCAVTAAAILTKATAYALVIPVIVAIGIGWLRRAPAERRSAALGVVGGALILALPVLGWLSLAHATGHPGINQLGSSPAHPFNIRQFLSYVWQFYLPRLPFLTPFRPTPQLPVYDIWIHQAAGTFGWLDVYLPNWMYQAAAALAAAIAITAVALLTRLRERRHLALLGFFALALLALLALLHITGYRSLIAGAGEFLQGRYLFPVIGLLGLAVGLIVARVPRSIRPATCGLVVTVMLASQVISLAAVVQAYYV